MRTLLLLRHAKSSWHSPDLDDHERPLNPRGTRDAPVMAKEIARRRLRPEMVLCSDAVRTRETLALMMGQWSPKSSGIVYDAALYLAEPATMLECIAQAPKSVARLMVLGHNPGMHVLALGLAGRGPSGLLNDLRTKFPTCGLAVLEFAADDWSDLPAGSGTLCAFTFPKQL